MPRPLLVFNSFDNRTITPSVRRMVGATARPESQIGADFSFTGLEDPGVTNVARAQSNVIQFGRTLYAWIRDEIWKYDTLNPSLDWQLAGTMPTGGDPGVIEGITKTGLMFTFVSGEPYLVGAQETANSNRTRGFRMNLNTEVIEQSSELIVTTGPESYRNPIMFRGKLYFTGGSNPPFLYYYDPENNIISTTNQAIVDRFETRVSESLVVYNGKLLAFGLRDNTNNFGVWEYDVGTNTLDLIMETTINANSGGGATTAYGCAWVGTASGTFGNTQSAWCIINGNLSDGSGTAAGWKLIEIAEGASTDPYLLKEYSTPEALNGQGLPLSLVPTDANGSGGVAYSQDGRWNVVVDQESNPLDPEITLYFGSDGYAGNLSAYTFDGATVTTTFLDEGDAGNVAFALPHNPNGGGGYFWTPGEPVIEIVGHESIVGANQRLSFKLYDDNPTMPVVVEFYFSEEGEPPTNEMTLDNPSAGSIGTSNTIVGLLPDGVTTYTVDWLAFDDGVVDGEFAKVTGRIIS